MEADLADRGWKPTTSTTMDVLSSCWISRKRGRGENVREERIIDKDV
jgi:hypothetical protein